MQVTKTLQITALAPLAVTIGKDPFEGYPGTKFNFSVLWTPVSSYMCDIRIDYGDGSAAEWLQQPGSPAWFSHTYSSFGTYTVVADVFDLGTGGSGQGSTAVEVASALYVNLSADKTSGDIPLTVTFTIGISNGFSPYGWSLNPGDGSTPYTGTKASAGTVTVIHTYTKKGTYTASVTVTDSQQLSASAELTLTPGALEVGVELLFVVAPMLLGSGLSLLK